MNELTLAIATWSFLTELTFPFDLVLSTGLAGFPSLVRLWWWSLLLCLCLCFSFLLTGFPLERERGRGKRREGREEGGERKKE